ncbi:hypothetical protein [Pontibacillus salipaludis]|uniref:Uncharacterized protein n=1 Tax=Pontibacillus salipaludis TaxID=1697394 RepID=A0ABQ1QLA6_9BACI|nr:hypothetical protein [Pontibacillus salipaludis]GGD29721.1 hypothetical protein GCM10011389_41610 [Pontibacillus salipaludis]
MSKIDEIKNRKRQQKQVTPTQAISEELEQNNVVESNDEKIERKRVSFDLRTDLHKQLKMQSLLEEKNIYILIEEALQEYLSKK